jgi:hypothetical protein
MPVVTAAVVVVVVVEVAFVTATSPDGAVRIKKNKLIKN